MSSRLNLLRKRIELIQSNRLNRIDSNYKLSVMVYDCCANRNVLQNYVTVIRYEKLSRLDEQVA